MRRTVRAALTAGLIACTLWLLDWTGRGSLSPPPLTSFADLVAWFANRDPAIAMFALLRLGVVVVGWCVAALFGLAATARLLRVDWLTRVADALTWPAVRRLSAGVAGAGLASGGGLAMAPAPAIAEPADPNPEAARPTERLIAIDAAGLPSETLVALDDAVPGDEEATMTWLPPGKAVVPTPSPSRSPETWVIEPGEHLWAVAEQHLAEAWGRSPSDAETAPYWRRLVERNRPRLPNPDDPDLVYPGLEIELEPAPPRP
jgi:hypothetical protein